MNGKQLCESLGIDRRQLNRWRDEGLPFTGPARRPLFDPDAVAAWLIEKGYAEPESPEPPAVETSEQSIVRTRDAVAEHFGVSIRTVATWMKEGMPGTAGSPGRRDGYFPLEEIDEWLTRRRLPIGVAADDPRVNEEARLKRARASMVELELARMRGTLVDSTSMAREWIRAIKEAKTQMDQLPAWLAKKLGDSVDPELRRELRIGLKRRLAESYRTLQLALHAQADALEGMTNDRNHAADTAGDQVSSSQSEGGSGVEARQEDSGGGESPPTIPGDTAANANPVTDNGRSDPTTAEPPAASSGGDAPPSS